MLTDFAVLITSEVPSRKVYCGGDVMINLVLSEGHYDGKRKILMAVDAGDEQCKAAGYHESSHIVIACYVGLPIGPKGIYINNFAE